MYEDDPRRSVGEEFEKLLYGAHQMGRNIVGYKETIKNFARKDFVAYLRKYYVANETVVCISGKFDEKAVIKQLQGYFGKFEKGAEAKFKKVSDKQTVAGVHLKFKKTDQ